MARAAVDSPADVEEAAVWVEGAGDKEIAGKRALPKGTGCLSVSNTKLLTHCTARSSPVRVAEEKYRMQRHCKGESGYGKRHM